ncbi:glyoxylate/hydroxypyruvate reductase, partial [Aureobasidium melanogenum]|uniref:D-mandelate dehydrogenase n=1 Tax=Aureobasidium melanogenum (strain CBS 110374) TaxID=1043003 RepID=A0A074W5X5_AURM1
MPVDNRPTILWIGDAVKHNPAVFKRLESQFEIIRPEAELRQRPAFLEALRSKTWGEFDAILRPFWVTGGEMGRWDTELVPLLPKSCKIFASAGAGYDWADVDVLAEHGILYCNGAQASSEAVADMAIFHILSVFRNLTWSHLAARSGDAREWLDAHANATMTAHNPRDHILGIIGLGNIGFTVAQKAFAGFGMKIHYYDVARKPRQQEEAVNATFVDSLESLLGMSDCVLLATPFGGSKVIDAERLAMFKQGSRFVNIARGTLVDEDALVQALKNGNLFAAGLDVFENEPAIHAELLGMRNVTLTCHNAGGAIETNYAFEKLAMENVEALLLTGKALTPVNAHLIRD